MPYVSHRNLRSQRDLYHYDLRRAIDKLAAQARNESEAATSFFHVIRCSYDQVPALLRSIPYSYHLFESSNLRFNPSSETIVCVPYAYFEFPLIYNLVKQHLNHDPISPHSQVLGSTYIYGSPSTYLYQWTQYPGQPKELTWELRLPAVFNNNI